MAGAGDSAGAPVLLCRAIERRPAARFIARKVKHQGGFGIDFSAAAALLLSLANLGLAQEPAADFPQFRVPGHEVEMKALNELHALHHGAAFSDCALWDPWLPLATLWTGQKPRDRYRASFLNRRIDAEGYVSVQQHRGMGHS